VNRRRFIDWMRGVAVLCMIEHHTFDAFLRADLHGSVYDRAFRFVGGVAAPSFLFLAGLSLALSLEKGADAGRSLKRAFLLLLGAYLFRFQEWALAFGKAPLSDLLRIDILNCIAVALAVVTLIFRAFPRARIAALLVAAGAIVLTAPLVANADLGRLPQHLGDYLNGRMPRAIFPAFPWMAHAFTGAALGVALARTRDESRLLLGLCIAAGLVWVATQLVDGLPFQLYPHLDWWQTSPAYFLLRNCSTVWILGACYIADRVLPAGGDVLSSLGRHSLALYWVHVEIVYGRWFWRSRGTLSLLEGAVALAAILISMTALAGALDLRRRRPVRSRAFA
jgi:uncharacterized membrane protein